MTRLREQLMQEGAGVALELRGVLTREQLARASEIAARLQTLRAEIKKLMGGRVMMPAP